MTSKLTRERLQEIAEDGFLKHGESKELARMALAEKASEPVILYRERNPYNGLTTGWQELTENEFSFLKENAGENAEFLTLYRHAQPAPEHPEVLPCSVLLEPGLRFGKGIKTSTMLAALSRRAVYESDLAALSPEERAEFQAGIEGVKALIAQSAPVVPESISVRQAISALESADAVTTIGQAYKLGWNACRAAMLQELQKSAGAEATCRSNKNVQDLQVDNSPEIPDGYVMVPVEPNGDMLAAAQDAYGETDGDIASTLRAAMLAAATQSPGIEPATVPGKWIPVSEQMPPSRHEVLVGRWWGEKPRWCCKWATYIPGHPDAQSSGWLIPGASWTPTHWMPLPAAPQEVKSKS